MAGSIKEIYWAPTFNLAVVNLALLKSMLINTFRF